MFIKKILPYIAYQRSNISEHFSMVLKMYLTRSINMSNCCFSDGIVNFHLLQRVMSNHSVLSLIRLMCFYLCVEGALILRSTRPKRTHGQREEGPSPEQPEAAVPRDGGHGLGTRGTRHVRCGSISTVR